MRIVSDSSLYTLIENPEYRPKVRALIQEYSGQSHATMVRAGEPGTTIHVQGLVLDEASNKPIAHASIELVHTDSTGKYFNENPIRNPRLFAYLQSNERGEFGVETIQPGLYKDDDGNDVPGHIHFSIPAPGFRTYAGEFSFADDAIIQVRGNSEGVPIAEAIHTDGKKFYRIVIPLQPD